MGPLLVIDDAEREVSVAASRLRVLSAALALRANQVVPAERLAELVWDGGPPGRAIDTLRSYVRRLRQTLGPAWAERIVTRAPGYVCQVKEAEVDALAFGVLCRHAGSAVCERRWTEASGAAESALGLWRGEPLIDVPCQALRDEFVPRLEQLRTQAQEDQAEADLALGRHRQLVQPLRELTAAHPLRERFHAQLMLALYRCGRQAEALQAYRDARRMLVDQLGVEPGPELRELHQQILGGQELRLAATPPPDHASASASAAAMAWRRTTPAARGRRALHQSARRPRPDH